MITFLLRRALSPSTDPGVGRERRTLARGLERLAVEPRRATLPARRMLPPIIDRDVAASVAAAATAMAARLRDPQTAVDDGTLRAIRVFMTDGCASPLYGCDPAAALLAVASLERDLRGVDPAPLHVES